MSSSASDVHSPVDSDSSGELMLWGEMVIVLKGGRNAVVDFERTFSRGSDLVDFAFTVYHAVVEFDGREPMAVISTDDGEEIFDDEARFLFAGPYDDRFGIDADWVTPIQREEHGLANEISQLRLDCACWQGDFLVNSQIHASTTQIQATDESPVLFRPFTVTYSRPSEIGPVRVYMIIDETEIPPDASRCNPPDGFDGKTCKFVVPIEFLKRQSHREIAVDPYLVDYHVCFASKTLVVSYIK
jgi:hypothetical protein